MKSNRETTKNKSYSSSSIRNLSVNKEQIPKHKPISKTQIYAKDQGEKNKIKYKRVAEQKPHTCDLKILSYKYATMEIGNGSTECLGREKMNRHKNSREKLKKI